MELKIHKMSFTRCRTLNMCRQFHLNIALCPNVPVKIYMYNTTQLQLMTTLYGHHPCLYILIHFKKTIHVLGIQRVAIWCQLSKPLHRKPSDLREFYIQRYPFSLTIQTSCLFSLLGTDENRMVMGRMSQNFESES